MCKLYHLCVQVLILEKCSYGHLYILKEGQVAAPLKIRPLDLSILCVISIQCYLKYCTCTVHLYYIMHTHKHTLHSVPQAQNSLNDLILHLLRESYCLIFYISTVWKLYIVVINKTLHLYSTFHPNKWKCFTKDIC